MRGGWIAGAVFVVALAAWLWRAGGDATAIAPTAAAPQAIAHVSGPPDLAGGARAPDEAAVALPETREPVERAQVPTAQLASSGDAATPTRLTLRVLDVDGAPWARGRLTLELRQSADAASAAGPARRVRLPTSSGIVRGSIGSLGDPNTLFTMQTDWTTDDEGVAELPELPPGLAFEVRALDAAGGVGGRLEGAPFAPGEVREGTLWLVRRSWALTGRCVDARGTPLSGVHVMATDAGRAIERISDAEGRFVFPARFAEQLALTARLRGYVRRTWTIASPSNEVELVLERARLLTVTLVDPAGERFTMHEMRAYGAPDDTSIDTYPEVRDGVHVFESMPWVPLTLAIDGCGGRPTLAVDARTEDVTWTLERPGAARFEWLASTRDLGGRIRFDLEHLGPDGPEVVESRQVPRGQPIPEWKLFPGRYRLQVLTDEPAPGAELAPIGAPVTFEVRAGQPTYVSVGG